MEIEITGNMIEMSDTWSVLFTVLVALLASYVAASTGKRERYWVTGIVTAVIAMAKSLEPEVIAEGVETREQLAYLEKLGCEEYQGYYFSRPVPADEFARLLPSPSRTTGVITNAHTR